MCILLSRKSPPAKLEQEFTIIISLKFAIPVAYVKIN